MSVQWAVLSTVSTPTHGAAATIGHARVHARVPDRRGKATRVCTRSSAAAARVAD